MSELYELGIKLSLPVRRGSGHFVRMGPDTLSRWPGHFVPMTRTTSPDDLFNQSGRPVQSVPMTCSKCFKVSRNLNYFFKKRMQTMHPFFKEFFYYLVVNEYPLIWFRFLLSCQCIASWSHKTHIVAVLIFVKQ